MADILTSQYSGKKLYLVFTLIFTQKNSCISNIEVNSTFLFVCFTNTLKAIEIKGLDAELIFKLISLLPINFKPTRLASHLHFCMFE